MKKNDDEKKMEPAAFVAQQQPSKKRNRKEVAIFGNYRNYYGYRVGQDLDEDPRLKMMKRELFEGQDCLDIGCNSGLITIAIAKEFDCRSILGVDIDGEFWLCTSFDLGSSLAELNKEYKPESRMLTGHSGKSLLTNMHKGTSKIHRSADVELASSLENNATELLTDGYSTLPVETDLLKIVSFQKGNFVQSWRPPENTYYHAILCLSVTKWINLNWGDDGLITLFRRVWTLLLPGGVFVLEPQPWSSYYSNRHVSETASTNYKNIQITLEDFQDVLLDKIGFRRVENITSCLSGPKSGFDRPVLAFWK